MSKEDKEHQPRWQRGKSVLCLGWRKGSPFQQSCVRAFSSLRATYTCVLPFGLVMPSVFTGNSGQPGLAAFPLLLFSFYPPLQPRIKEAVKHLVIRVSMCHLLAGEGAGSCLKKPREALQNRTAPAGLCHGFLYYSAQVL